MLYVLRRIVFTHVSTDGIFFKQFNFLQNWLKEIYIYINKNKNFTEKLTAELLALLPLTYTYFYIKQFESNISPVINLKKKSTCYCCSYSTDQCNRTGINF